MAKNKDILTYTTYTYVDKLVYNLWETLFLMGIKDLITLGKHVYRHRPKDNQ